MCSGGLTHVDGDRQMPTMVDVQDKAVTVRHARARTVVTLPDAVLRGLQATGTARGHGEGNLGGISSDSDGTAVDFNTAKGPVFCTAIIAGTMAVKRTSELIPFCHPLPIEKVAINVALEGNRVLIDCNVSVTHKTGVEMEALTGASIAALCVYDMCKALSHDIVIGETRLMHKSGGKRVFNHEPT